MRNAKVNPVVVLSLSVLVGLALVVLSLESVAKDPGPAKEPQPAAKKPEAAKESGPATKPAGASGKLVEMKLELPRPLFEGTPRNIKAKMRPVIRSRKVLAAPGLKNLAYEKKVTSSDEEPIIGELALANDGDKEGTDGSFVELGPQLQWVQIDLGAPKEIHLIVLWHYHREGRVYRDVIVQAADDKDFITNVRTLFNNDHDNSAGLGIGKDWQYLDDFRGEVVWPAKHVGGKYVAEKSVKARYVRFYSNGNTSNDLNHYTEIEIWGK